MNIFREYGVKLIFREYEVKMSLSTGGFCSICVVSFIAESWCLDRHVHTYIYIVMSTT